MAATCGIYLVLIAADKCYTEWNKMIRYIFNLPFDTHRFLIEPISKSTHLKTKLTDRFLKFFLSISLSARPIIHNLYSIQAHDLRSEFGLNIYEICHAVNVSDMSFINRGDVKYHPVPDCENWRVDVINEILSILNHNLQLDFEEPFLKCIRDFLCSN